MHGKIANDSSIKETKTHINDTVCTKNGTVKYTVLAPCGNVLPRAIMENGSAGSDKRVAGRGLRLSSFSGHSSDGTHSIA